MYEEEEWSVTKGNVGVALECYMIHTYESYLM